MYYNPVSIPSLAGQTARLVICPGHLFINSAGFNPLISGADRAAGSDAALADIEDFLVSIPSLAGQTARPSPNISLPTLNNSGFNPLISGADRAA